MASGATDWWTGVASSVAAFRYWNGTINREPGLEENLAHTEIGNEASEQLSIHG